MENYPIYKAKLEDLIDGIFTLSFVEYPAVESNFIAYSKEKPLFLYQLDEEKREVLGCILRADFPIFRINPDGSYCYHLYEPEVIKQFAAKALKDGGLLRIDLDHDNTNYVDGVYLMEAFIKDTENGVNPKGFDDVADGSLFGRYKVLNDAVWQGIKEGKYNGFSIEAFVSFEPATEPNWIDELISLIDDTLLMCKN